MHRFDTLFLISRLETILPDSLHTIADIIEDMTALDAATGGEETADDTGTCHFIV